MRCSQHLLGDSKIHGGIDCRLHPAPSSLVHPIAGGVLRRVGGQTEVHATFIDDEKVFVEMGGLTQEGQRACPQESHILGMQVVIVVVLRKPTRGPGPVNDVGLQVFEPSTVRCCDCRDKDTATPIDVTGIGAEIIHHPIVVVKDRQQKVGHVAGKRLPVDHLQVFVGHVK